MKKVLKYMAMIACVIPCLFLVTACGGNPSDVNIDVSGNYKEITQAQFQSAMEPVQDIYGYRMKFSSTSSAQGRTETADIYSKTSIAEDGSVKSESTLTMNGAVIFQSYIDSNTMFVNNGTQKCKAIIPAGQTPNKGAMSQIGEIMAEFIGDGLTYTEAVNGDIHKIKAEANNQGLKISLIYVLNANTLVGAKVEMSMDIQGISVNMNIAMEAYTGDVSLPELKDFVEVEFDKLPLMP